MLPKPYRLVGQRNFKKLAIEGKSIFLKELGLKWLENGLDNSRFAFVVSTQIDKRATIRNKIKRRLRQIIHLRLKRIKPGFDLMFLTRSAIKNLDFPKMEKMVESLLAKANLI
jgi:ribonuclease P protein component